MKYNHPAHSNASRADSNYRIALLGAIAISVGC